MTIGGTRWRTHSTKRLDSSWLGEWTVSVIDGAGRTLRADTLQLVEAGDAEEQSGEAAPPAAPEP